MQKQILSFVIAGLFVAGCSPLRAQEHGRDWDRAHRIIEKTQDDLRHVEHHDAWAVTERGHYDAAERNLADVRRDLDKNRLDRGRLEAAISEIEHITHVNALDPKPREVLGDDLRELRRLRDDWRW